MCTLIAFHRVWDDAPLVIAVNRDEALDRPSSSPAWLDTRVRILAPRDDRAGGTWMGANAAGVWVGLTNRHCGAIDPARRSRGLLCLDLLASAATPEVVRRVAALEEPYNPFNLVTGDVAGDDAGLHLIEYADGRARTRRLESGCHIVTNRPFDESNREPKVARTRALLAQAGLWPRARLGGPAPPDVVAALGRILSDHGARGDDALCLHGARYGTRSAGVWRIMPPPAASDLAEVELFFADGPPCNSELIRVDHESHDRAGRRAAQNLGEPRRAESGSESGPHERGGLDFRGFDRIPLEDPRTPASGEIDGAPRVAFPGDAPERLS